MHVCASMYIYNTYTVYTILCLEHPYILHVVEVTVRHSSSVRHTYRYVLSVPEKDVRTPNSQREVPRAQLKPTVALSKMISQDPAEDG
jgi:hypothetical protein